MMTDLLNLGDLYISDFLAPGEKPRADPAELRLVMDDNGLVHLAEQPDPSLMWGRYWYRSGTNATMTRELHGIVDSVGDIVRLEPGDVWLDIGSNDGTLLSAVDPSLVRIGIDPADDTFTAKAEQHADAIVQAPFSLDAWYASGYGDRRAKVVTCIAMFYDLMDPIQFLADVREVLDDDGLFVLQMSYTPLMLSQVAFDNICHEHARYYTLKTLVDVLAEAGLQVLDCRVNEINGGSFRVYACRPEAHPDRFGTRPWRDVARLRFRSLMRNEDYIGVNEPGAWVEFRGRVEELRRRVRSYIERVREAGQTVWGYGASTKGNTLLQYFGLDNTLIDAIAERQPQKYGLRTVGTDIPIVSEDEMRAANPDYLLILPWHFVASFRERERDYLARGGRFIVPCPRFEIIGG